MELKQLRSFVTVSETQSFSIAASRCFITQPAISQQIKQLETEFDCKLLIRTPHGIELTDNGKELYGWAKELLKKSEDCKEHMDALNNCITGELRIGIGSFITPYVRKAAITFMKRYHNVMPNAEFAKACRLNQMLRNHQIDIAFTMNVASKDERIETHECIPFHLCAIMRKDHPLATLPKVSYEDLRKYEVIMPDVGEKVFNTVQKHIKQDLSRFNVRCIVNNPYEALAVVEEVGFITFLPKMYIDTHPALTAKPVIGIEHHLMSNAHWMKDVPLKRSAQLFLDIIREEIANENMERD